MDNETVKKVQSKCEVQNKSKVQNKSEVQSKSEVQNISEVQNNNYNQYDSDSNYVSPESSPIIESNKDTINVPLLDNNKDTNNSNKNFYNYNIDSIILNLKIVSKLKPGYKLSVKENNVFIDTSYLQYFYRFFSDNSRETTTKFLENLDNDITKKIEELVSNDKLDNNLFLNSKENILLSLNHNLNLSLVGLNNLINTYNGDDYIISKIELIINNFDLKIRKICDILKIN